MSKTADVFISGLASRETTNGIEVYRVINVYREPTAEVEQIPIRTARTQPDGVIVKMNDKQFSEAVVDILAERGYTVIEQAGRGLQTFSKAQVTVLTGMFRVTYE